MQQHGFYGFDVPVVRMFLFRFFFASNLYYVNDGFVVSLYNTLLLYLTYVLVVLIIIYLCKGYGM